MSEKNKKEGINIELTEEVAEGIYSNLAIINHSPSEFVVDFIQMMPGILKAKVKSRVILTPQHAKRLMSALSDNISKFDMIINTTSIGLQDSDAINLDYKKAGSNKLFYDVIYNPIKTDFLLEAEKHGNKIENGKMMFIYQAQLSFELWHNILPKIDRETIEIIQ